MSDQVERIGSSSPNRSDKLVDLTEDELVANKDNYVIEITEPNGSAKPSLSEVEGAPSQNGSQTRQASSETNQSPTEALTQVDPSLSTNMATVPKPENDGGLPALVPESQSSLPPIKRPASALQKDDKPARIIFKRPRLAFDQNDKNVLSFDTVGEDNLSLRHFKGVSYYFDRETHAVFLDKNVREHSIKLFLEKDQNEPTPCQLEWLLRATTFWELNLPIPSPPTSGKAKGYFNGRGELLACAEEINISKLASGVTLAEKITAARNVSYLSVQEKHEMFDSWVTRSTKLSSTLLPNTLIQRSNTIVTGSNVTATKQYSSKAFSPPEWGSSTEPCKCRKSHCLKKYCLCFSKSEHCSLRCNCRDCLNVSKHRTSEAWLAAVLAAHGPMGKAESAPSNITNGRSPAAAPASRNVSGPASAKATFRNDPSVTGTPASATPTSAVPSATIPEQMDSTTSTVNI